MDRVVLDSNAVVSALLFRGTASRLHAHWRAGHFRMVASAETLAELARVFRYPKFKLSDDVVKTLLAVEVVPFCELVKPEPGPAVCRDPGDDKFLWCARDGHATLLVSGDPDLLALKPEWSGIVIVTIAEFLAKLETPPG